MVSHFDELDQLHSRHGGCGVDVVVHLRVCERVRESFMAFKAQTRRQNESQKEKKKKSYPK